MRSNVVSIAPGVTGTSPRSTSWRLSSWVDADRGVVPVTAARAGVLRGADRRGRTAGAGRRAHRAVQGDVDHGDGHLDDRVARSVHLGVEPEAERVLVMRAVEVVGDERAPLGMLPVRDRACVDAGELTSTSMLAPG